MSMNISNKIKATFFIAVCAISFTGFSQSKKFKVTLDAGHGGKDFGAVYNGHIEKNIALAVTLKVGRILESQPNIEVNYTRKTDVFIELIERANIANRVDASIFVSMHCNANEKSTPFGTQTFVMGMTKNASNLAAAKKENEVITQEKDYKQKYEGYDPNLPETLIGMTLMQEEYQENSIALASKVQDKFTIDLNKKNRGISQAPFMVLHKAYMPRVLIEMGFISNPKEGEVLDSEEGQDEIANAIADAIISYKKEYFGNGNQENEDEKPSQRINGNSTKDTPTPVKKEVKILSEVSKHETKTDSTRTIFKVQISASNKKLDLTPSNFKGLKNISIASGTTVYKYMYGETSDYNEAKILLQEARTKGYDSAFVIAFKNGKSLPIQDALK
jgi:N-acetylmuramoyl-L-alanine amidase